MNVLDVRFVFACSVDLTMSSGMNILIQLQVACRDGGSHFLFVVRRQCLGRGEMENGSSIQVTNHDLAGAYKR